MKAGLTGGGDDPYSPRRFARCKQSDGAAKRTKTRGNAPRGFSAPVVLTRGAYLRWQSAPPEHSTDIVSRWRQAQ